MRVARDGDVVALEVADDGDGRGGGGRRRPGRARDARAGRGARRHGRERAGGRRGLAGGRADPGVIRVVLADDQTLVRAGFRALLDAEDDIEVVGEAADGEAAFEVIRRERPDVVLMDVRMPRADGLTATGRVDGRPRARRARA